MEKIVVSACLLGEPCRYDGKSCPNPMVIDFCSDKQVYPVCPEVLGGLLIPRISCEIRGNRVISKTGENHTKEYQRGARKVLELMQREKITMAVLKSKSPSCGVGKVYDGTFTGTLTEGDGICAQMLKQHGLSVMNEEQLGFELESRKFFLENVRKKAL